MKPSRISLFVQCLVDAIYPDVAEAMVRIFERLGISVTIPVDQTCCGQMAYNSGYYREAKVAARRFIRIFENAEVIVAPSGSCVNMVSHHYPELFKDESQWLKRAKRISGMTFELSQFLVDVLGVEDVGARYDGTLTYHDSCHLLRNLKIKEQPRKLIQNVKGATFLEMKDSDRCCGFGGTFSFKYPEISTAMLEDKVQHIVDSGADGVVGCDVGCLMNMEGMIHRKGLPLKTIHMAQLLGG
jgi:L-lactate dehydrogenase complex protein LldE